MAKGTDSGETDRDTSLNAHQRVHAAIGMLPGKIAKDKVVLTKGGAKMYDYISHDAVTAHVRPAMHAVGLAPEVTVLSCVNNGNRVEMEISMSLVNIDNPEDRLTTHNTGYGADTSDKGPGKAYSYAVKGAYLKAFMLNSADDIEEWDVAHDPETARVSDVEREREQRQTAQISWMNIFRDSLKEAETVELIESLMKENKAELADMPQASKDWFAEFVTKRKTEINDKLDQGAE